VKGGMEVDAVKWITEVEQVGEKNARSIARLYERVDQVRAELEAHRVDSKERSDKQLNSIMRRFDKLDGARDKRVAQGISFLVAVFTAVWFAVIDPMQGRMAILERRFYEADTVSATISDDPKRM